MSGQAVALESLSQDILGEIFSWCGAAAFSIITQISKGWRLSAWITLPVIRTGPRRLLAFIQSHSALLQACERPSEQLSLRVNLLELSINHEDVVEQGALSQISPHIFPYLHSLQLRYETAPTRYMLSLTISDTVGAFLVGLPALRDLVIPFSLLGAVPVLNELQHLRVSVKHLRSRARHVKISTEHLEGCVGLRGLVLDKDEESEDALAQPRFTWAPGDAYTPINVSNMVSLESLDARLGAITPHHLLLPAEAKQLCDALPKMRCIDGFVGLYTNEYGDEVGLGLILATVKENKESEPIQRMLFSRSSGLLSLLAQLDKGQTNWAALFSLPLFDPMILIYPMDSLCPLKIASPSTRTGMMFALLDVLRDSRELVHDTSVFEALVSATVKFVPDMMGDVLSLSWSFMNPPEGSQLLELLLENAEKIEIPDVFDRLVDLGFCFTPPTTGAPVMSKALSHEKFFERLAEYPEFAAECQNKDSILLQYLKDPTLWPRHQKTFPLITETCLGHAVNCGMNIDSVDETGRTALHILCDVVASSPPPKSYGRVQSTYPLVPTTALVSIEALLRLGADPFIQDCEGRTAIDAFFALYENSKNAFDPKMESLEFLQSGVWKKFAVPSVDIRRSRRIVDMLSKPRCHQS